jgi:hypothetical protein
MENLRPPGLGVCRSGPSWPERSAIRRNRDVHPRPEEREPYGYRRGLTFAKLAECQYVIEALGDLPLRVAYKRLAGMVRMLGEDVQAWLCTTPTPLTCPRRTPSLGAVSALQASMGTVSDTIELYEGNMIDELALRLVQGELPVGS